MPTLTVRHVTTYRYRQAVAFGEHRLMFRPREGHDQRLLEARLDISPAPASLRWVHDVFGNCVAYARFAGRACELRFESFVRLDHSSANALDFEIEDYARTYPFTYDTDDMPDLLRSIERHAPDPGRAVAIWARQFLSRQGPTDTRAMLVAMTMAIKSTFTYVAREEKGVQTAAETLRLGRGSCRDFAILMIDAVRSLGLAARFVSGYLYSPAGEDRVGGGATHAWVRVYLPGAGWIEFDPTNGIIGNHGLIRVAVTRDPRQAIPLSGSWTGFPSDCLGMTVDVSVKSSPAPTDAGDETAPMPGRRGGAAQP